MVLYPGFGPSALTRCCIPLLSPCSGPSATSRFRIPVPHPGPGPGSVSQRPVPLPAGDPWLRLHHNGRVGTAHRRALQSALLLAPDPAHGTGTGTDTGTAAPSRIAAIILPRTEPRGAAQQ